MNGTAQTTAWQRAQSSTGIALVTRTGPVRPPSTSPPRPRQERPEPSAPPYHPASRTCRVRQPAGVAR